MNREGRKAEGKPEDLLSIVLLKVRQQRAFAGAPSERPYCTACPPALSGGVLFIAHTLERVHARQHH